MVWCYDNLPSLKIIFSGSPLMLAGRESGELTSRARIYTLEGFSFREYLNFKSGNSFERVTLEELLSDHVAIAGRIVDKVKPLAYFTDYLHHGYYPFFQEQSNYLENLLRNINLMLEIDISFLQQIEHKYLPKLRKLLYLIASSAPFQPNISKLSSEVETSRATIINYLKYLQQACLINQLFDGEPAPLKSRLRFICRILTLCIWLPVMCIMIYSTGHFSAIRSHNIIVWDIAGVTILLLTKSISSI